MDGYWYINKVLSVVPKHSHTRLSAPEMDSKDVARQASLGLKFDSQQR